MKSFSILNDNLNKTPEQSHIGKRLKPVHTSCEWECDTNFDDTNSQRIDRTSWAVFSSYVTFTLKNSPVTSKLASYSHWQKVWTELKCASCVAMPTCRLTRVLYPPLWNDAEAWRLGLYFFLECWRKWYFKSSKSPQLGYLHLHRSPFWDIISIQFGINKPSMSPLTKTNYRLQQLKTITIDLCKQTWAQRVQVWMVQKDDSIC